MGDLEQRKRLLPEFKLMRGRHVSCDVIPCEPEHRPAHQTAVPHNLNRLNTYNPALGYPERIPITDRYGTSVLQQELLEKQDLNL